MFKTLYCYTYIYTTVTYVYQQAGLNLTVTYVYQQAGLNFVRCGQK